LVLGHEHDADPHLIRDRFQALFEDRVAVGHGEHVRIAQKLGSSPGSGRRFWSEHGDRQKCRSRPDLWTAKKSAEFEEYANGLLLTMCRSD
jgi:hypothetical protein